VSAVCMSAHSVHEQWGVIAKGWAALIAAARSPHASEISHSPLTTVQTQPSPAQPAQPNPAERST
jgi:hypothetical protein